MHIRIGVTAMRQKRSINIDDVFTVVRDLTPNAAGITCKHLGHGSGCGVKPICARPKALNVGLDCWCGGREPCPVGFIRIPYAAVVYVGKAPVLYDLTRRLQVDDITAHTPGSHWYRPQNNVGVLVERREVSALQ